MDISLSLTHDCNLACTYCYAGSKRQRVMESSMARKALDFAFGFSAPSRQLGFFGGEPLLAWELLQDSTVYAELLAAQTGTQLKKTVTTNGTLLTEQRVDWLHEHGFYPALSLDGNRDMHDATRPLADGGSSFGTVRRGLHLLLARFPEAEVVVVPDPVNVQHLAAGVRFLAEEEGVRRISINPNFYAQWDAAAMTRWGEAFEQIGDFYLACHRKGDPVAINFIDGKVITRLKHGFEACDRCNFGEREIAVAPSGRLYPCERLIGEDIDTTMSIGTVDSGFDEAKRSKVLARRGNIDQDCLGCAVRNRCMNWCCCINYTLTGHIDQTDGVVCFHERTAITVADRVAGQLFKERNPSFMQRFYCEHEGHSR